MANPILPGTTIGIFGSGQLGRMMTLAAKQMGYRVHTYSPQADSPTGQVADREVVAAYDDADAVMQFAQSVDVVTFEFENVDARVADISEAAGVPVHPSGWVLRTAQNRISEKSALLSADLPVMPFIPVRMNADLSTAAAKLSFPIVLKTATSGYDGRGQIVAQNTRELADAWDVLGRTETVAETWLDFDKEISVIVVRSSNHESAVYRAFENTHVDHILDASVSPAGMSAASELQAQDLARRVAEVLNTVGALCVEFFLTRDETLLINEIAPRPHNSGHLTIEGAVTSQFEQHIRAICGLPLGSIAQPRAAAMVNLLGDLWAGGAPAWGQALCDPDVKLHLYGKLDPRPGRKMGHLTVVAPPDVDAPAAYALQTALSARSALSRPTHRPVKQSV